MTQSKLGASEELLRQLTIATKASVGVIVVRCAETEVYRVIDEIYSMSLTHDIPFYMHSMDSGWQTYSDNENSVFDPLNPAGASKGTAPYSKAFDALYSGALPDSGYFAMIDLYFHFAEPGCQAMLRKQMQRSLSNDQRLFIVVPFSAELPEAIAPLVHVVEYGYPTRDELAGILSDLIAAWSSDDDDDIVFSLSDDDKNIIVTNGQGMSAYSFETAIALSVTSYVTKNGSFEGFTVDSVLGTLREYKTQMLKKTNVLELQPAVNESDVGGLDYYKEWVKQRALTYTDTAKNNGITPSRGALVVGVPGSGKSLVAKAAGSALNLPVIRFDVGRVFGQYVGQSEQSMRAVLKLLDAMAPIVLMLDEIDKGFAGMAGGGGDSGTTQRVFGTFLTWMQERDQAERPIFLIMTANRIAGLPPELLRKGRVDEIWAVGVPNAKEREVILNIHARKRGYSISPDDMGKVVNLTNNLVGAELEATVEDALVLSLVDGKPSLKLKYLKQARNSLKPMYETRAKEFAEMREWADKNARPASPVMRQSPTNNRKRRLPPKRLIN